jgi:sn-glycerol 3-phosphate transport system substrate-binding protein
MLRGFMLGAATSVVLAATPAHAVIELQWWHAMTGGNNEVVVKLANDFNASQSEYKVVPTYKGSYPDTMNAGIAAFRAGNAPHIMQVFEVGTATMMAATGAVKPVHVHDEGGGREVRFERLPLRASPAILDREGRDALAAVQFVVHRDVDQPRRLQEGGDRPVNLPKTWPEVFEGGERSSRRRVHADLRLLQCVGHLGQRRADVGVAQPCRSPPRRTARRLRHGAEFNRTCTRSTWRT